MEHMFIDEVAVNGCFVKGRIVNDCPKYHQYEFKLTEISVSKGTLSQSDLWTITKEFRLVRDKIEELNNAEK